MPNEYISVECPEYKEYEVLDWLAHKTQEKLFIRARKKSGVTERGRSPIPKIIMENAHQIIEEARSLGMLDKTYPQRTDVDCTAIFGSTAPYMNGTITDFKNRIENDEMKTKKVFLLSGERYADERDNIQFITQVAKKENIPYKSVTEAHLMKDLYQQNQASSKMLSEVPYYLIDTPQYKGRRPTTYTTLKQFLGDDNSQDCKSVLFISRAPHIAEQGQTTKNVIYMDRPDIYFEIIGGKVKLGEARSQSQAAAYLTTTFASNLYGGYERAVMKINFKYHMCPSIDSKNLSNSIPSLGSPEFKSSFELLNIIKATVS